MKFISALTAGFIAAVCVKIFSVWLNKITNRKVDLTWYMGRYIINVLQINHPEGKWKVTGYISYFLIAMMISVLYQLLWSIHVGYPNVQTGLLFGFLTGLSGLGVWRLILVKSANPPFVPVKFYFINYMAAYILYGIITVLAWQGMYYMLTAD